MALKKQMSLQDYVEVIFRWKWFSIFSFLLIVFGAFAYCVVSPEMYKATATILVVPPKVGGSLVESTVTYSLGSKIDSLSEQLLSRTRLYELIKEINLYPDSTDKSAEELVEIMRERIEIEVLSESKGRNRKTEAFSVTYSHEDPETSFLVTNRLVSLFIDENQRIRTQQASGTTEFLGAELEKAKKELDEKDIQIKEFRIKYYGELPEQLDLNMGNLERFEEGVKTISTSIRDLESERTNLETRLAVLNSRAEELNIDFTYYRSQGVSDEALQSLRGKLILNKINEKKDELAQMRLRYTESHPAIKQALYEIEQLEKALMAEQLGDGISKGEVAKKFSVSPEVRSLIDQLFVLNERKASLDEEIAKLQLERSDIQRKIRVTSRQIENIPKREFQWKELTREYETLKQYYEDLLAKRMNAELSQNLEVRQQGEQFQILDPPIMPEKPYKPARMIILLVSVFASLIFGFGGAVSLEYLDQTIRSPGEFRELFDIPILVSLPLVITGAQKKRFLVRKTLIASALIGYFAAVSTFMFLYVDKIRVILFSG